MKIKHNIFTQKPLFLFIFILINHSIVFSQGDFSVKEYSLIEHFPNENISFKISKYFDKSIDSFQSIPGYYEILVIFNYADINDTFVIGKSDFIFPELDTIFVQLISYGESGKKGFIVTSVIIDNGNFGEHGAYSISKKVIDILDIESKKIIFTAVSEYNFSGEYNDFYDEDISSSYLKYSYVYDFSMTEEGNIEIKNTKVKIDYSAESSRKINDNIPSYFECNNPDYEEGIYIYQKGNFELKTVE